MAKDGKGGKRPLTKKEKTLFGVLLALIAALFVAGVLVLIDENTITPTLPYEDAPNVTPPPETPAPETPVPTAAAPGEQTTPALTLPPLPPRPVYIYFPEHKIKTEIVPVGINADGEMATVEDAHIATWYWESASPGQKGNAIIAGHVTWKGKKGDFAVMGELKLGEAVNIEFDKGYTRAFEVVSNDTFPLGDIPEWVMDLRHEDSRVTLITCAGEFDRKQGTRDHRTVVVLKETAAAAAEPGA